MRTAFYISLFLFLHGIILPAQIVLHTSVDTTPAKTTVKVAVLNPHGKQAVAYSGHSMPVDSVQQALKINPANFLRGDFSLYYEYRLARHYSVEGALGVTYVDYVYELTQNAGRFILKANEANAVKFYSGVSTRLQFRWYPSRYENAISGYYFAPEISYRTYKMDYLVNTGLISEPHRLNRKYTDIRLQFGRQDPDPYDSFFWEWYLAAGFRHFNQDYVEKSGLDAEFGHEDYWGPVVGGGIKLGFNL
ncbi:hypothetical protein BH11BAC7_BH11BAC7_25450 [soil metagenome]